MKVFIVSYCFPNERNPQSGCFVLDQCRALRDAGCSIVVLNVAELRHFSFLIKSRNIDGIPVLESFILGFAQSVFFRSTVRLYRYFYNRLIDEAIKEYGIPDIFYVHFSFPTGIAISKICESRKLPYAVMEHSSMFNEKIPNYIKKNVRHLVNGAHSFMSVSESLKSAICTACNIDTEKVEVIPNILSSEFSFHKVPKNDIFTFFSAGNLIPIKQFDILIESVHILQLRNISLCVRIAGEGSCRNELYKLIDKYSLHNNVILLGRLERKQMLHEYINCNAFVLPSKSETFGVAFREAMIVGRPVVSFNNGGIMEGWNDKYGIIVKKQTPEALAEAMQRMMKKYGEYDPCFISYDNLLSYSPAAIGKRIIDNLQIK